jgi:hypothetical protein
VGDAQDPAQEDAALFEALEVGPHPATRL